MSNKKYDFYFSYETLQQLRDDNMFETAPYICNNTHTYVNDIEYTEMIEHGREPLYKNDDLILVYTGYEKDFTITTGDLL